MGENGFVSPESTQGLERVRGSQEDSTLLASSSFTDWSEGLPQELTTSSSDSELPHFRSSIFKGTPSSADSHWDAERDSGASFGEKDPGSGTPSFGTWLPEKSPSQENSPYHRYWKQFGFWISARLTFYRLHFLYFTLLITFGTVILYVSPKRRPSGRIPFMDALFNATSASCVVGLNSIDMQEFSISDQVVMMCLIMAGGHVFTSLLPVLVRRHYFNMLIKKYTNPSKLEGGDRAGGPSLPSKRSTLTRIVEEKPLSLSRTDVALADSTGNVTSAGTTSVGTSWTAGTFGMSTPNSDVHDDDHATRIDDVNDLFGSDSAMVDGIRQELQDLSIEGTQRGKQPVGVGFQPMTVSASYDHAHTWAGETAKLQGQRARLAIDIIRLQRHHSKAWETKNKSDERSEDETEDDGFIDPSVLRTQEYRALLTLSWLVPAYLIICQLVAFMILQLNFLASAHQRGILDHAGVSSPFFSAFQAASSFQNAGLVLLSTSLADFRTAALLLFTVGAMILLGNTMYAPTMRGIINVLYLLAWEPHKSTFKYLLDHPRKCYTHLFPWNVTKWLLVSVIAFNATELFFFCVLDWNQEALDGLKANEKLVVGLFQSMNTRSAGFLVLNLGELSPAMLVLYIVMMYVAVYPVYLSRQTSREKKEVYDEVDIAIFEEDPNDAKVLTQSRKLLLKDSGLVFMGLFIICIVESNKIRDDPNFSIFNLLFEVVSAYGNVGLSMGYSCVAPPNQTCISPSYSLVGAFKPLSKLVLVFLMLLGRHRGLPDNIDAAITIPERKTFRQGRRRTIKVDELDPVQVAFAADLDRSQHGPKKSPILSHSPSAIYSRFSNLGGSVSHEASPIAGVPRIFKSNSLPSVRPNRAEKARTP